MRRLLITASVPPSPILVTLMKEALSSSETLVLTRATQRNISEDAILHSHLRENLKYYIILTFKKVTSTNSVEKIHLSVPPSPSLSRQVARRYTD
jgi:hypothetical protein